MRSNIYIGVHIKKRFWQDWTNIEINQQIRKVEEKQETKLVSYDGIGGFLEVWNIRVKLELEAQDGSKVGLLTYEKA